MYKFILLLVVAVGEQNNISFIIVVSINVFRFRWIVARKS